MPDDERTAVLPDSRTEQIEDYVVLDALATFLSSLRADVCEAALEERVATRVEEVAEGLAAELLDTLWPEDAGLTESPECVAADVRSTLLAAQLFAAIAVEPSFCVTEASRLAGVAAANLRGRLPRGTDAIVA